MNHCPALRFTPELRDQSPGLLGKFVVKPLPAAQQTVILIIYDPVELTVNGRIFADQFTVYLPVSGKQILSDI